MLYVERIKQYASGLTDKQTAGVKGHMRVQYSTLDRLSSAAFEAEVHVALVCQVAQQDNLDSLADSYGIREAS